MRCRGRNQESGEQCKAQDTMERFSMGITCGEYCDPCWDRAGFKKDEEFDPSYAGETLDAEE